MDTGQEKAKQPVSDYQQPWWLVVNRPEGLVTTVEEEYTPAGRLFTVRGEPVVQGLAWRTWGPVAALLVVAGLAVLAIGLNVKEQPAGWVRPAFVAAFLALPALAWGATALLLHRAASRYLQAERQAGGQMRLIRLDREGLGYKSSPQAEEYKLPYGQIGRVRLARLGDGQALRLLLETDSGPVVLLDEGLGTRSQKAELLAEIERALEANPQAQPESGR